MSKLSPKELFRKEDYKDAPEWWSRAFSQINAIVDTIYGLGVNGVSFENITGSLASVTVTLEQLPMKLKMPIGNVSLVMLAKCNKVESYHSTVATPYCLNWWIEGNMIYFGITGIVTGSKYDVSLLIM